MAGKKTDFDPDALTSQAEQHGKNISDLDTRVSVLEGKFKPEEFAMVLEAATADSKKVDKLLSKTFCEMLDKDEEVKKAMACRIKASDRSHVTAWLKRWGSLAGAGVIYVAGILTNLIIQWAADRYGA